jgi:hypothetical protein
VDLQVHLVNVTGALRLQKAQVSYQA